MVHQQDLQVGGGGDRPTADFLANVESHLDLPEGVRREVIAELRDHLADSTAGLEAEGRDPDDAAHEAIARLGNPESLAGSLARARQTRRRLLAAIGGSTFAAAGGGLLAFVIGAVALFDLTFYVLPLLQKLGGVNTNELVGSATFNGTVSTSLYGLVMCVAAFVSGRIAVRLTARVSCRPESRARLPWAVGGGSLLALWALVIFSGALDLVAALILCLVPVAFAAGALLSGGPALTRRRAFGLAAFAAAIVLPLGLMLASAVVPFMSGRFIDLQAMSGGFAEARQRAVMGPQQEEYRNLVGAKSPLWGQVGSGETGSGLTSLGAGEYQAVVADTATIDAAGYTDLRAEAWPSPQWEQLGADLSRWTPFLVVPMTRGDGSLSATLRFDAHRNVSTWEVFLTGLGTDGRRHRIADLGGGMGTFTGSVWQWLLAQAQG